MWLLGRIWAVLCLALLLHACGGGGGGSDAPVASSAPSATVARQQVVVSAAATDTTVPYTTVDIALDNLPKEGIYLGGHYSTNGLSAVNTANPSASMGQLLLTFKPPWTLPDGTYTDRITVQLCLDEACTKQVNGSPFTVTVTYTVSGSTSVTADRTSVAHASGTLETAASPAETVRLTLQGPTPVSSLYVVPSVETLSNSIWSLTTNTVSPSQIDVNMRFYAGSQRSPGSYADTVKVRLCYDPSCYRELLGSPVLVNTTLTVSAGVGVDTSLPELPYAARTALSHDVVDAEYSRSLDALVMVSSKPSNALIVHDPATGTERRLALNLPPAAVSVSPDGNFAAVAHDARVTYVDLREVGVNSAYAPTLLNVSSNASDIVLDGRGYAHVMPATDQWVAVHTVKIATNTESLGTQFLYAAAHGRLHPTGTALYVANNGVSPDDIERYNLSGDGVTRIADSPYHGDYPMCGDLWFSEDGGTIYTACGRTFRSSTDPTQDMRYSGTMAMSTGNYGYRIRSLSQRAANKQIVLIEEDWSQCNSTFLSTATSCTSHVALYESDFLNRTALYTLPPIEVSQVRYSQQGLFVSHLANGNKAVVSRLVNMADPSSGYYVTLLPADASTSAPMSTTASTKLGQRWR
jgi:hypothetical protein